MQRSSLQQICDNKDNTIQALELQMAEEKEKWIQTEKELVVTKDKLLVQNQKVLKKLYKQYIT